MKEKKYIGYRWYHGKGHDGIKTHSIDFYEITISDFGYGPHISDEKLFNISFQGHSDKNRKYGEWYGFHLDEIKLEGYYTDLTFKLIAAFKNVNNGKSLGEAIRKIKGKKVFYNNYKFIPWRFKDNQELYLEAIKKGFELKKLA